MRMEFDFKMGVKVMTDVRPDYLQALADVASRTGHVVVWNVGEIYVGRWDAPFESYRDGYRHVGSAHPSEDEWQAIRSCAIENGTHPPTRSAQCFVIGGRLVSERKSA